MTKRILAALAGAALGTPAAAQTFTNPGAISIPDAGSTSSTLNVSGLNGRITGLTLTLNGLTHGYVDDLVIGLASQSLGQGLYVMSFAGGAAAIRNVDLTFSDAGAARLPRSFIDPGTITSGTYRPSNFGSYAFTTYANVANFSGFNGLDPNGAWQLFVADTSPGDVGVLERGFSLNFAVAAVPEPEAWALMIVGFGLVGASLRSRRHRVGDAARATC